MRCSKPGVGAFVFFLGCLMGLPRMAGAVTKERTCGPQPGKSIAHFLGEVDSGDTLLLNGTCNENVTVGESFNNIIIDGQGQTTINAPDATRPAVRIRGKRITLRGLTIVGGRQGVHVTRGGTATINDNIVSGAGNHGILVSNGGFATIVNNTIENNGNQGIQITESASADIGFRSESASVGEPNTIRNNGGSGISVSGSSHAEIQANSITQNGSRGIVVNESSSARIGFRSGAPGSFASANTIEANGSNGVAVTRSSSARIVENILKNNGSHGVFVQRGSHADVAGNQIDGNTGDGVLVTRNSGVNLGNDSGTDPDDLPNTTTVNNTGRGIRCRTNSYADGRLGSLNGAGGAKDFGRTFIVDIEPNGSDADWGPVDESDDANPATANATQLTIFGSNGSIPINSQGCHDSLI